MIAAPVIRSDLRPNLTPMPRFQKAFVSEAADKAFHEPVLHRFAGSGVDDPVFRTNDHQQVVELYPQPLDNEAPIHGG